MVLDEFELNLCAAALGLDHLAGFDLLTPDEKDMPEAGKVREHLAEEGILESADSSLHLSALAQYMFRIMSAPDAWFLCRNEENHSIRRIYVLDADWLCADQKDGTVGLQLLPVLHFALGALADFLDCVQQPADPEAALSWTEPLVHFEGKSGASELKFDISREGTVRIPAAEQEQLLPYSVDACVNRVSMWLLTGLRESRKEEEEEEQ